MSGNIKQLREQLNISQAQAAEAIGVSRPTFEKIEADSTKLTVAQEKELANLLGVETTSLHSRVTAQATETYDENVYKSMIRNFITKAGAKSDGRITKTKLAKLLYLADFAWFYSNSKSMSGLEYRRLPQGPVPNEFFRIIDELYDSGEIDIKYSGRAQMVGLTEQDAALNDTILSPQQQSLIDDISKEWKDARTETIVNYTHSQLPWKLCESGEIIPYDLITQEDPSHVYQRS